MTAALRDKTQGEEPSAAPATEAEAEPEAPAAEATEVPAAEGTTTDTTDTDEPAAEAAGDES
jgi:hypothetical protein